MACVISSAYDMLPQAFLIFFGSDLGVCGIGDSHSGGSCLTTTTSPVGDSVAGWLGSGSGHVLERERASLSNGAYSILKILSELLPLLVVQGSFCSQPEVG